MKATIIKIISNQYTIVLDDNSIHIAYLTGKVRLKKRLFVGDHVEVQMNEGKYGIVDLYDRTNCLKRPFIANVDKAYILMSYDDPKFSFELVNRLAIIIEYCDVKPVIVVTKSDLGNIDKLNEIKKYYELLGYDVYFSYKNELNMELLTSFKKSISVLCGQSGVGKSSILNTFNPNFELKTNETSKALGRGKHTTRHVELFKLNDGLIADTPGFSSIDLKDIDIDILRNKISCFKKYNNCFYRDCMHINEPNCSVKKAIDDGLIPVSFYETYTDIIKMIKSGNYSFNNHRRLK